MQALRWLTRVLAIFLATVVLGEVSLRFVALFVHDRSSEAWRPGSKYHVLCVGDSHTYGAGVPESESYPHYLQEFLDQRSPGAFSVLNLGVPGMSTTQVNERMPANLGRLRPDVVLVWCGVNDSWNAAGDDQVENSGWRTRLDGLLSRLRFYRLLRVWAHDRALVQQGVQAQLEGTRYQIGLDEEWTGKSGVGLTVQWGGVAEHISNEKTSPRSDEEAREHARRNYFAMMDYANAAGVPIAFVTYPLQFGPYGLADKAIMDAAHGRAPIIDSSASLARIPKEQVKWGWVFHPTGPIYKEIARDAAEAVVGMSSGARLPQQASPQPP